MTVIGISPCVLLFAVSVHFEVVVHSTGNCRCYSCNSRNRTGDCMNTTTCELIATNGSSATGTDHTESHNVSLTTSFSSSLPTPFYSCNVNCSTVNTALSQCPTPVTSASTVSPDKVVVTICASVLPSVVVVLSLIGLVAYCQLRRMEKKKKDPPKMLPKAQDIDASMRATSVPEGQATSRYHPNAAGVSDVQLNIAASSGASISGLKRSNSSVKEDWTPPGISKSGPLCAETSRSSPLVTDKTSGRAASKTQPTYTNVETTRHERVDHDYINVDGVLNDDDGNNSPDYVNTQSGNSVDDDELDYENVDVNVTTAPVTTTVTSTTPTQRNSPLRPTHQSKGLILTSPGKAVSPDWLVSISKDKAAPMDSHYIDMTAKSKLKTTISPKSKNKATPPAAMFVSAPNVRMMGKKNLQPVSPLYQNQPPAVHKKPKTRTVQDLPSTSPIT